MCVSGAFHSRAGLSNDAKPRPGILEMARLVILIVRRSYVPCVWQPPRPSVYLPSASFITSSAMSDAAFGRASCMML